MARILLIEDDGYYASVLREALKEHEVICAYSYNSAIGLWREYKGNFDCIVLDLMIDPDGLDRNQIDEFYPVHGILVLEKICEGKMPDESEEAKIMYDKTIIHSGYTKELEKFSKFSKYNSLKIIPKERTGISIVIAKANEIIKNCVGNGQ